MHCPAKPNHYNTNQRERLIMAKSITPEEQLSENWLSSVKSRNVPALIDLLEPDVELRPPFETNATIGREDVLKTFYTFDEVVEDFSYHRVISGNGTAVLEFKCKINGIPLQGMDIFTINADQKIESIEVVARPLEAIQALNKAIRG